MQRNKISILFTSVGNLAFPSILADKNLNDLDIDFYGTDIRESAHGLYFCKKGFIVPRRENAHFRSVIYQIIKNHNIGMLWPLSTEDQGYFSSIKSELEEAGVKVICSNANSVGICNDKLLLYETLSKNNIPVPDFSYPLSNIAENILHFGERGVFIKARIGTGGMQTYLIPGKGSSINPNIDGQFIVDISELQQKLGNNVDQLLATEYLPGREYSVDCLSNEGEMIYGAVRLRNVTGKGLAMECEIVEHADLIEVAKHVIKLLNLSYINNLQFREDISGNPKLIDINPRIPGTIQLTLEAGLPMVSDCIKLSLGEEVVRPEIVRKLKLYRYLYGVVTDSNASNLERLNG